MRTNKPGKATRTHEGGVAMTVSPKEELHRAVLSCLLFERTFYEDGNDLAKRIAKLVPLVEPLDVATLADSARNEHGLRHVSLFLIRELARHPRLKAPKGSKARGMYQPEVRVAHYIERVVQRADELAEFLAMYWKDGKQPLSKQTKKGLAKAFAKFNAYGFGKYKGEGNAVKPRDVMFMTHPKPTLDRVELYKKIAEQTLEAPDTWEVRLSAGLDKKTTWTELIIEGKLGGLATLRNVRNMREVDVPLSTIKTAFTKANFKGVLPFQFFAAAKAVPTLEHVIEPYMLKAVEELPPLKGRTGLLIDVSGSMSGLLSDRGTLERLDAAAALAVLMREKCEDVSVYTFSDNIKEVPARRGFALRDVIVTSQPHGGTYLKGALSKLKVIGGHLDRLVVITDEQSHDGSLANWAPRGYSVNVAPYKPGLNYGQGWTHINGWSDRLVAYIQAIEQLDSE